MNRLNVAVVGIVAVFAAYGLGTCGRVDASELAEERAQAYENGYRVARAYVNQRQARVDTVTQRVVVQSARVDTVLVTVDAVLADTSADVPTLRNTLSMLRTEVVTYRVRVDSLVTAHRDYRKSADSTLALADSTIGALKDAVAAERKKRWRHRAEGLVGGLALAGLLAVL